MKKILPQNNESGHAAKIAAPAGRENNWCEKYGYFIDLDACRSRSLSRSVCRRCYKSLLQLSLPFGTI
ncbi:MAG TPA: hypothetical protein PK114_01150 [Smithellaceae bacterium]|nr:hypothetical protein [Smithellaceae bacterium]